MKRQFPLRLTMLLAVCFGLNNPTAFSQVIYNYTNASSGVPASVAMNVSGTSLARGMGVSGMALTCTGATDGFGADGWPITNTFNTIAFNNSGDYIEFKLAPQGNNGLKLTAFSAQLRRENLAGTANDGPLAVRYAYKIAPGGPWTSGVNPGNPQSSNVCASSGVLRVWPSFGTVFVGSGDTICFRIYGLSSGSSESGDFYLHNVEVGGEVCANTPTITPAPDAFEVCAGTSSVDYIYVSDEADLYSIDYDAAANSAGFSDLLPRFLPGGPDTISLTIPPNVAPGLYYGTFSVQNTCGFSKDYSFSILVRALPTLTCPSDEVVCITTDPYALSGGSPLGGTYSGAGVNMDIFDPEAAGVGAHTMTYTVTDMYGCSNFCTFSITVNGVSATANAGADQMTCVDGIVLVSGSITNNGTGIWSAPSGSFSDTLSLQTFFTPPSENITPITLTLTPVGSCTVSDDILITYGDVPPLNLSVNGPSEAVCGDEIVFRIVTDSGFIGLSSLQFGIDWDESQLHYVGHSGTVIDGAPPAFGTMDTSTGLLTYSWFDQSGFTGETLPQDSALLTITFKVLGSGGTNAVSITDLDINTFIEATNAQFCILTVNVSPASLELNPIEVTCPDDYAVCIDADPIVLSGGTPAGGTYSGMGVGNGMFDPGTAMVGTHTITYSYTNQNDCSNECSFDITVNPLPDPTILATPSQICPGSEIVISFVESAWPFGTEFTVGADVSPDVYGQDSITYYNVVSSDTIHLTEGLAFFGSLQISQITVTEEVTGCSTAIEVGPSVDVPVPVFGFSAQVDGRSEQSGSNENGTTTITIDFCAGEYFSFVGSGYFGSPANIGFIEHITGGTGNTFYGGNPIPMVRPETYVDSTFFNSIPYGPYNLGVGETYGQIIQTFTPYLDIVNPGVYDPGVDCLGDTIILVYNIYAAPTGAGMPVSDTICSGETTDIALSSNILGTTFTWEAEVLTGMVTGAIDGSGSTIQQPLSSTGFGEVVYHVTAIGPAPNNCADSFFDVFVTVNPPVLATITPNQSVICQGDMVTFTFSEIGEYPPGTEFTVTADVSPNVFGQSTVIFEHVRDGDDVTLTEGMGGDFTGTLTASNIQVTVEGAPACSGTVPSFVIKVNPSIAPSISGPTCVHVGSEIQLTADNGISLPGIFGSGVWSTLSSDVTLLDTFQFDTVLVGGLDSGAADIYYTVTDNAGCIGIDTFTIEVLEPLKLITSTNGNPVGCGDTIKVTVTVENFCDVSALTFSADWDDTKFTFVGSDTSALLSAEVLSPSFIEDLDFFWFGDSVVSLPNGTVVLCYYLKALGNTGSDDVSISVASASNGYYSTISVDTGDPVTIVIAPLSFVLPPPSPVVCPSETMTTLHFTGVVGNPNYYGIDFGMDAEAVGFPPTDSSTLVYDMSGSGNIIIDLPPGVPHGTYHGSVVISNTLTGCESIPYDFVIVVDTVRPVAIIANPVVSVSCDLSVPVIDTSIVSATDNCPGVLLITHLSDVSNGGTGCCADPDSITRTYRVTDLAGNFTDVVQLIIVKDCEAPVIDTAFHLNPWYASEMALRASISQNIGQYLTDNCSTPSVAQVDVVPAMGPGCGYDVTIFIKDECNNGAAMPNIYATVIDDTPPVVVPGTIVDCYETIDLAVQAAIAETAIGTYDACSAVTYSATYSSFGLHCQYDIVVTATDACGHADSVSYTTRVDNTAPIILAPEDISNTMFLNTFSSNALEGECYQSEEDATAAAMALVVYADDCSEPEDIVPTAHVEYVLNSDCDAIAVVEVTDECGNVTYVQFPGIRIDSIAPVIPDSLPLLACFQNTDSAVTYIVDFVRTIVQDCTPAADLTISGVYELVTEPDCESGIVIVTVTDCAGNIRVDSIAVDIDPTAPEFLDTFPSLQVVCLADIPPASDFFAEIQVDYVFDDCSDVMITVIDSILPSGCGVQNQGHYLYEVKDCAGNTASQIRYIILNDNVPPTWEDNISSSTLGCSCDDTLCIQAKLAFVPVVVDNGCASIIPTLIDSTVTIDGCTRTITRTWTAADDCGNQIAENFVQTILIQDEEAPTFDIYCQFLPPLQLFTSQGTDCPSSATISLVVGQVISPMDNWVVAGATIPNLAGCVSDNCTATEDIKIKVVSIVVNDNVPGFPCARMITVAFELSDACGNITEAHFMCQYLIIDNVAPTWNTPVGSLNFTLQCSDAAGLALVQNMTPVPHDLCDANVVPVKTSGGFVMGSCPQAGTYTNTWTATDCSGNTSSNFTQVITIIDNVAPTWTSAPGALNATVSCSNPGQLAAAQALVPTATDCDPMLTPVKVSGSFVPNNCPETGTITNTWTVTDHCGNTSLVYTQVITVVDNTAPTYTAGSIASCYTTVAAAQAAAIAATIGMDNCSNTVTKTAATVGTCSAVVTVTLSDCSGNTSTVTYNTRIDNTPPTLTKGTLQHCYPDIPTAEAAAKAATTRTDNCPGGLGISATTSGTCPAIITVTVTDGCGNSSSVVYGNDNQTICIGSTVVMITNPAQNDTVDCSQKTTAFAAWLANHGGATSNVPNAVWTYSPNQPVFHLNCNAHRDSTIVTFTATDGCGNTAQTTATFFSKDITPPTANPIATTNLTCRYGIPLPDANLVTGVNDNCDNSLTIAIFSNTTMGLGCPGNAMVILRTYSVTDDYCNTSYVTHTINVVDNVSPTFTAPANITINVGADCNYNASEPVTGDVTDEHDNCYSGLNAKFTDVINPGVGFQNKWVISRTWQLIDSCGNAAIQKVQTITVKDVTPPTISCPNPVSVPGASVENNSCAWTATGLTPTMSDNCPGATLSYSLSGFFAGSSTGNGSINGTIFLEGETTVTYTVTDAVGNTATCSFVITVNCTTISGRIIWEHNHALGVKDATVRLTQGMTNLGSTLSDVAGNYSLTVNTLGIHTVTPVKNINRLNGVTSADATAIQQHLAGTNIITDPYKKVAADVNRTGFITSQDATLITQCLAGNPTALSVFNVFWRFTPTTFVMPVTPPSTVAVFPENINVNVMGPDIIGQDFYGMKIGDVNGSADPSMAPTGTPLVWMLKDQQLVSGAEIELNFAATNFNDLAAVQFALDFDPAYLQFVGFESLGNLSLTADNFGDFQAALGELRFVWSQAEGVTLADGTPVLKAKFKVLKGGQKLSAVVQLDESVLPCKAYTPSFVASEVRVVFVESVSTANPIDFGKPQLQLFQNQPNPFAGETTIGFVLPGACDAQLRIMDVSGRELTNYKKTYTAGYHEIEFRMENAAAYGVLYYELVTPFGKLTKKMVTAGK